MKLPHQNKPCKDCPFRKDSMKGWLGEDRALEISSSSSFVCHKNNAKQCAGYMLVMKYSSSYYSFAKGMKVDLNLSGEDLVFDNREDFVTHHS